MEEARNSLLIADDDTSCIMALSTILRHDYTIYVAKSGKEALETALLHLPDVILLDVLMPDMDGYAVLSALKEFDKTKDIPVIFITELDDSVNEKKGLALGAADYMNKSLHDDIIRLRIRNHIQSANQFKTIERLNKNLEAALTAANTANKTKSNFLARMSHEIRTPMNAILGITEILLHNTNLASDVLEGIYRIHSSGDMLLGIINDILDLSKIEAGKFELAAFEYDTVTMIIETLNLNKVLFNNKPVEFTLVVDDNVPARVMGDALRIKQILNNLLSNAAKYTLHGEVGMEVTCEQGDTQEGGDITLVFVVRDTGIGMTPEEVSKLFDEYTRFHDEAVYSVEGTGLGMGITRNLLQMMKGEIFVESEKDHGSAFTVRIPQKRVGGDVIGGDAAEKLREFRLGVEYIKGSNRRSGVRNPMPYGSVLVVDDSESNLYVAQGLFMPYGLKITTAASGYEAVDIVKGGAVFDIIFMDHMMPGMDGIETTRHIRDLGYDQPVVALTADALVGQAEIFLGSGFDGFITKPVDMRHMDAVLNKFIRDKQPPEVIEAAIAAKRKKGGDKAAEQHSGKRLPGDKLMKSFAIDARRAFVSMENVLEKQHNCDDEDLRLFTIHVHSMKSALAYIGENELNEKAAVLEMAGAVHDVMLILEETPAFLAALREIVDKTAPPAEEESADATMNEDEAYLLDKLAVLHRACKERDIDAANITMAEIKQKTWTRQTNKHLRIIGAHLLHGAADEAAAAADIAVRSLGG